MYGSDMNRIRIIEGGISVDYRGRISHVNDLDMSEVERFYKYIVRINLY